MRLILFVAATLIPFGSSAHALSLLCDFESSSVGTSSGSGDRGHAYKEDFVEAWVPRKQAHILDLDNNIATFYKEDLEGKITYHNKKRVQWRYSVKRTDGDVKIKYQYLKPSKRMIVSVSFGSGYIPIENIRGTCKEFK